VGPVGARGQDDLKGSPFLELGTARGEADSERASRDSE
jgi:hypothetical protein